MSRTYDWTRKKGQNPSTSKTRSSSAGFRRWLARKIFGDHRRSVGGRRTPAADDTTFGTVNVAHGSSGYDVIPSQQKTKTINVTTIQKQQTLRTNALCGFKDLRRSIAVAKGRRGVTDTEWGFEFRDYYAYYFPEDEDEEDDPSVLVKYHQDAIDMASPAPSPSPREFDVEAAVRPYDIRELLGTGGHGVILLVSKAGKEFVAKLAKESMMVDMTMKEFMLIQDLRHSNIVRALGPVRCGYLMEKVHTDLSNLLEYGTLNSDTKHRIVAGVLSGLRYLHSQGIAHLDLKPDNILLDIGCNPKIADFGVSERFLTPACETVNLLEFLGTPAYMAPELLRFQLDSSRGLSMPPLDIWACGCLAYEILTSEPPFGTGNNTKVIQAKQGSLPTKGLNVPLHVAAQLRNSAKASVILTVAQKMLQILPSQRPTAEHLASKYFYRN